MTDRHAAGNTTETRKDMRTTVRIGREAPAAGRKTASDGEICEDKTRRSDGCLQSLQWPCFALLCAGTTWKSRLTMISRRLGVAIILAPFTATNVTPITLAVAWSWLQRAALIRSSARREVWWRRRMWCS